MKREELNFTLHPNEFEKLFEKLEYFIVDNYLLKDKNYIFSQYQLYYEKITSGVEWKKDDWKLNIHIDVTDSLQHIKCEKVQYEESGEIKKIKRSFIMVPSITISPFSVMLDYKERITVKYFDHKYNSNIGLQISYPKQVISSKSGEIISTEEFSTYKLYLELVKRIKKVSKKAKAKKDNNISSPNFWISPKCLNEINKNIMMKRNTITLI